ncbi:hypothetical protein CONCODRAFT_73424 [Conidiobolus coronatus NRRL 28638]|uniref:F-box domain-containing protein n=1 Tax=Conidiobolus coronatus (strain ATCC 28846 / CBS 209.66 / NRRL 28638) TaxID=796925 RepID=A0A137NW35_CONC2|nr:hypothetical protein CONCODRAFT_73424 [Conidiobolus coronatus NRRL 28638]|eukprot:KXN66824.1 hypothetical protein CONCODRAFT_73424 [Conidiobolus coronatus NRRL 28638]
MSKNCEINWLNVISNREFKTFLDLNLVKEISMISKLMREKLKPKLFKNLILNLDIVKFESNIITMANDKQFIYGKCDYNTLREENEGSVEDSLNDFIISLNDIKKFAKSFYFDYSIKAGYYLYPLIGNFNNLTELKIKLSHIPFKAFADIGKTLPNLNRLELECVDLIKSAIEVISEKDIVFPPNLSYLKIFSIYVIISTLLSDPYEYLFNTKVYPISYEYFTLSKISIPSLKRLDFIPKDKENRGLEEFLELKY